MQLALLTVPVDFKETFTVAHGLGVTDERANDFDILVDEILERPEFTITELVNEISIKLNPTEKEWMAFFYGFGIYCGRKGIF